MRVSRRAQPSQVGCGASVARRRLLHVQACDSATNPVSQDQPSVTDFSMVIEIDLCGARKTLAEPPQRIRREQRQDQVTVIARSSARGW